MRIAILLAAACSLARGACLSVPSQEILAGDIASAVPSFDRLAPETFVGYAPFPGTVRVFSSREIFLLAARHGLPFPTGMPAPSVCVKRAVRRLSVEEVKPALITALAVPDILLEVLDVSPQPVPPGQLEFQRGQLNRPRNGDPLDPVIWRGRLIYDGQHSLSIWAKVRISVSREAVVAIEEIPAGTAIRATLIKTETSQEFPSFEPYRNPPATMQSLEGKMARRTIASGERITSMAVEDARDVIRGEMVHVHVTNGAATITLDGIAQASGNKGQTILVHNPSTGRNFRAVVQDQKQVVVLAASGAAL